MHIFLLVVCLCVYCRYRRFGSGRCWISIFVPFSIFIHSGRLSPSTWVSAVCAGIFNHRIPSLWGSRAHSPPTQSILFFSCSFAIALFCCFRCCCCRFYNMFCFLYGLSCFRFFPHFFIISMSLSMRCRSCRHFFSFHYCKTNFPQNKLLFCSCPLKFCSRLCPLRLDLHNYFARFRAFCVKCSPICRRFIFSIQHPALHNCVRVRFLSFYPRVEQDNQCLE